MLMFHLFLPVVRLSFHCPTSLVTLLESSTTMTQNAYRFRARRYCAALVLAIIGFAVQPPTFAQRPADKAPPLPAPIAPKTPVKIASEGQFTDKANGKHTWQINAAHALIWDGKPYLPVGGAFTPHSFASDEEKAWQEDVRALDMLQSHGIQDILVWPDKPLPDIAVKSVQRLLDYLDTKGFHYGVSFGPGMTQMASGYVVKPSVYRKDVRPNLSNDPFLTAEWITANTDRGVVFMYDLTSDSKLYRDPYEIAIKDSVVTVPVEQVPLKVTHPYVLLLPHKTLPAAEQGALPDVWTNFDRYRDRALAFAAQVKWGVGLRFFLDPLTRHLGLSGETPFLVPDSMAFRLEWEGFLARKYGSPEEVRNKWALMETFKSFADLSRQIPLWAYGKGCPYFFDSEARRVHPMQEGSQSVQKSVWWNDFQQFRDGSLSYYMNTLADVFKRQAANVPIVYTWTPSGSFFTNYNRGGGFDGLVLATRPGEPSRLARTSGPAYSQAEQSVRTTWFFAGEITSAAPPLSGPKVSAIALTDAASPAAAPASAYASKTLFARDLDDLRRIGSKGFFINSLQNGVASTSAANGGTDWSANPEGLAWIGEYAKAYKADNSAAAQRPRVLFYPQNASGPAHTGLVPGTPDVYWLPGAFAGDDMDMWPFCRGYNIRRSDDEPVSTVLVSLLGPQKAHFPVLNPSLVRAFTPTGTPVPIKIIAKNTVEIPLDTTPVIAQFGSDVPPVPQEAAVEVTVQLDLLYEIAKLQKVFGIENSKLAIDQAKDYIVKRNYGQAYYIGRGQLDKLMFDAAPYIWLEGEYDLLLASNNPLFNELAGHPEASGGAYLRLSTPNRPMPEYGYKARYEFTTAHEGVYQIWLAGTVPGPNTSPIKWRLNNDPDKDIADPVPHGPLYMNERFGWVLLGTARLGKGDQKLTIDVTDPAAASTSTPLPLTP